MVGISGKAEISVNFGTEPFKWLPANGWVWKTGQEKFVKPKS